MFELNRLSLNEMLELQKRLPGVIEARRQEVKMKVMASLRNTAARHGFVLEELLSEKMSDITARSAMKANENHLSDANAR